MLLDTTGKLVKKLDFRGTKFSYLDKVSAKDLLLIMASAQQLVNAKDSFKATDLLPKDWSKTIYQPIMQACEENEADHAKARAAANRLFGVIIKQALIMTPLLFSQTSGGEWEGVVYSRESLDF
ncbi:MAG: hypothetical protein FWD49_00945 [Firmicutes bacterium]|nr:hypothetical protein [Bacillota bacterium]